MVIVLIIRLRRASKVEPAEDSDTRRASKATQRKSFLEDLPRALSATGEAGFSEIPGYIHMQGALLPDRRFGIANPPEPYRFENEFCRGLILPLFRPTQDKTLDTPEGWAFGAHFHNRKRLWEIRYEIHMKVPLEGELLFGLQGHSYTPITRSTRMLSEVIKAAVKQVIGGRFYYSPGDDPGKVSGERELPICSVPLWAFDQFILTPEGEEPPSLTDPDFHKLGHVRGTNRRAFVELMSKLQPQPGPTYTFGFWGISQLFDALKWEIQGLTLGSSIDFNRFCGGPPVHQVLYTLDKPSGKGNDQRHLESRKKYYLRFAFWSSQKPPSWKVVRELIPEEAPDLKESPSSSSLQRLLGKTLSNHLLAAPSNFTIFGSCCTARTRD